MNSQKNTTTKSYTTDSQFNLKLKSSNVNFARPNRQANKRNPHPILWLSEAYSNDFAIRNVISVL